MVSQKNLFMYQSYCPRGLITCILYIDRLLNGFPISEINAMKTTAPVPPPNHVPLEGAESDEAEKSGSVAVASSVKEAVIEDGVNQNLVVENVVKPESPDHTEANDVESNDKINNNDKDGDKPELTLTMEPTPQNSQPDIVNQVPAKKQSLMTEIIISTSDVSVQIAPVERAETGSSSLISITDVPSKPDNIQKAQQERSTSDESATENNNKKSYLHMKSKRKNLIRIDKITDSDSRSRDKMRRRGLSPPSSSDEENLYIGFIAYPASLTSFRGNRRRKSTNVACNAFKFILSPVAKACQKCRRNRVSDHNK